MVFWEACFSSAYARLTDEQRTSAWRTAQNRAESLRSEYDFRAIITARLRT